MVGPNMLRPLILAFVAFSLKPNNYFQLGFLGMFFENSQENCHVGNHVITAVVLL